MKLHSKITKAVLDCRVHAVKELLTKHADPVHHLNLNALYHSGRNEPALHVLCRSEAKNVSDDDKREMARLLIDAKATPDAEDIYGECALTSKRCPAAVLQETVSRCGVNVNRRFGGRFLLHVHCTNNDNVEQCRVLINAKADIDVRDHNHFTPLMSAVMAGCTSVTELLLSEGADVSLTSETLGSPGKPCSILAVPVLPVFSQWLRVLPCQQVIRDHLHRVFAIVADVGRPQLPIVHVKVVMEFLCVDMKFEQQ